MTTTIQKVSRLFLTLGLASALVLPVATFAQGDLNTADLGVDQIQGSLKLSGGANSDVRKTAANLINVALGFLGIIAVVIVLIGGFKYMVSGGSEDKTSEARRLIVSGIIGLAIILSAWAITGFVINQLISATAGA